MAMFWQNSADQSTWLGQKKWICILLLTFLTMFLAVPGLAQETIRVSVLDFSGTISEDIRIDAINRLTKILLDLNRFEVVERAEMDRILDEQHLQMTGLIDQSLAVEIGKILAVDVAFLGHIGQDYIYWDSNRGAYVAEVLITVKIVDVQSGKLLHMIESMGYGVDYNRTAAEQEAVKDALSLFFVGELRDVFSISTSVTRVRGRLVYFLNGEDIRIRRGSRLYVYRSNLSNSTTGFQTNMSYQKKIGLIEVVDVQDHIGQAKILWSTGEIREGDLLEELSIVKRPLFNTGISTMNFSLLNQQGFTHTGTSVFIEIRSGLEKPFSYTHTSVFSVTSLDSDTRIYNMGMESSREVPIINGNLYLTVAGGCGYSIGLQEYMDTDYSNRIRTAKSRSYYVNGSLNLKYYFRHDRGLSLEAGITGQYGPFFSRWEEYEYGYHVTDRVEYRDIDFSGFGFKIGLNYPINLDAIF